MLFFICLTFATPLFAREVLDTFRANGKTYEIFEDNGSVFLSYGDSHGGMADTHFTKGGSCWTGKDGSCNSTSEMVSKIKSKFARGGY